VATGSGSFKFFDSTTEADDSSSAFSVGLNEDKFMLSERGNGR
jgi:hypothetical protein